VKEKIISLSRTLQAVAPLVGNAIKSGQLFNPQAELTEPDPDILCEYDVRIPMSEGFSVTANISRSKKAANRGEKVPVVMCAHPFNNHLTPVNALMPSSPGHIMELAVSIHHAAQRGVRDVQVQEWKPLP
jgi:hypothetical protein